jgi:hypothetical protein
MNMTQIQEVFLEKDWEDLREARSARDQRVAELQAQGFICNCETLQTVYGQHVFVLQAMPLEQKEPTHESSQSAPSMPAPMDARRPKLKRSIHRTEKH